MSLKSLLNVRRLLMQQKIMTINCIRGTLRSCGKFALGASNNKKFVELVREAAQDLPGEILLGIEALLGTLKSLFNLIDGIDEKIEKIAKNDEVVQLLMTTPGVGVVTALTYKAEISDPKRFKNSRSVGAYVGMTPRQYSSGETERQGSITKAGPSELRSLLSDAAMSMMYASKKWSRLKLFGLKIKKKNGHKKSVVALGRKLAVVLHRMWTEGKPFEAGEVCQKELDRLEKPSKKEKKKKLTVN